MKNNRVVFIVFLMLLFLISGFTKNLTKSEIINDYKPSVDAPEQVFVEGGLFQMGNTRNDSEGDSREIVHTVELTYDYYMGKFEITNEEYLSYLNNSGISSSGSIDGKRHIMMDILYPKIEYNNGQFCLIKGEKKAPVIDITWWGAIGYCNWLSEKEGLAKAYDSDGNLIDENGEKTKDVTKVKGYRLPSEAEWEYAAKGGLNSTSDFKYAGSNNIDMVAWYDDNTSKIHEVGQKAPNELGLHDMSGNVYEWCHDLYGYYSDTTQINPIAPINLVCPDGPFFRILRGGFWDSEAEFCRIARRSISDPNISMHYGFRIARTR